MTAATVAGHEIVLSTTNGTRALRLVTPGAVQVLLGCLLNVSAVAEAAFDLCRRLGNPLSIVCAGREGNAIPCLDDTYTAGVIVSRLEQAAKRQGARVALSDAARISLVLANASTSPLRTLADSATADVMRRASSEEDVEFCARLDVTDVVPALVRGGAEARWPVVLL
jgi:2-phosphosulfolactate phosphatase